MKNIIKVISFIILISGFAHADIVEKLTSLNNLYKENASKLWKIYRKLAIIWGISGST